MSAVVAAAGEIPAPRTARTPPSFPAPSADGAIPAAYAARPPSPPHRGWWTAAFFVPPTVGRGILDAPILHYHPGLSGMPAPTFKVSRNAHRRRDRPTFHIGSPFVFVGRGIPDAPHRIPSGDFDAHRRAIIYIWSFPWTQNRGRRCCGVPGWYTFLLLYCLSSSSLSATSTSMTTDSADLGSVTRSSSVISTT